MMTDHRCEGCLRSDWAPTSTDRVKQCVRFVFSPAHTSRCWRRALSRLLLHALQLEDVISGDAIINQETEATGKIQDLKLFKKNISSKEQRLDFIIKLFIFCALSRIHRKLNLHNKCLTCSSNKKCKAYVKDFHNSDVHRQYSIQEELLDVQSVQD